LGKCSHNVLYPHSIAPISKYRQVGMSAISNISFFPVPAECKLPWKNHFHRMRSDEDRLGAQSIYWYMADGNCLAIPDLEPKHLLAIKYWMEARHCTETPYMTTATYRAVLEQLNLSWSYLKFIQPIQFLNDVKFKLEYY